MSARPFARTAYQAADIATASPGANIVTLYEAILVNLTRARGCIAEGKIEEKTTALAKAGDIVMGLTSFLDMEKGGEISARLFSLYRYFSATLLEINRDNDLDKLESMITMISELHETWREAVLIHASVK